MQTKKVTEYIIKWLKDYQESSHSKGFCIGVSGGIDSAVVSTLCARTGAPVLAIEMPIRQSSGEMHRSRAHINWLKANFPNASSTEVNLTEIFETFEKTVNSNPANEVNPYSDIAFANVRSRLRMVRIVYLYLINDLFDFIFSKVNLYYFASLKGYLVAGTGNKVEDFGVGFFTKYGKY
jgi:NAD+ synthase